jgi:hypothetical protein
MNAHARPAQSAELFTQSTDQSSRDFVLASLRCTCLRIKLIENEITAIGTALRGGLISPDLALEWAEEMAPGCIGFIPNTAYGSRGAL